MLLGETYSDAYVQGGDWQTEKDWSWGIHVQGGEVPSPEPEGVIASVKRTARKAIAILDPEEGQASMGQSSAPIWPWIAGLALLGGGAYLFLSRKRRK